MTARLQPRSGFAYLPVAGLAPLRDFYTAFGEGGFWSTQYLRHASCPLYTPEPDLCHEVLGHANQLGDPAFADICRACGLTFIGPSPAVISAMGDKATAKRVMKEAGVATTPGTAIPAPSIWPPCMATSRGRAAAPLMRLR